MKKKRYTDEQIAAARPRFGYRRLGVLLRREGWVVNSKRVYRIYREEGLEVRTKRRRKRASHVRLLVPSPKTPNEQWSMDFVTDRLESGRQFRVLTVVDNFSRECPLLEAGVSLTGKTVARTLSEACASVRQLGCLPPRNQPFLAGFLGPPFPVDFAGPLVTAFLGPPSCTLNLGFVEAVFFVIP